MSREVFFEQVQKYTKYKLVEMLTKKHKGRFDDLQDVENLSEDVLDVLTICGMKFYTKGKTQE